MTGQSNSKSSQERNKAEGCQLLVSPSLEENIDSVKRTFEACDDVVYHYTEFNNSSACLIYLYEMVNNDTMVEIESGLSSYTATGDIKQTMSSFISKRFSYSKIKEINTIQSIAEQIVSGNTVLLIDGIDVVYVFHSSNPIGRLIGEPNTERTVRGPREGFVEDIQQNLKLIRRKIKTPSLKVESLVLGKETNTQVNIVYIQGTANDEVVQEVRQRLSRIKIDGILESHYVESMIKDSPKSPFPTIFSTERPDRVCGSLLDGKVAILVDGTPFVMTVPTMFVEFLHSSEDYYDGSLIATIIRWARFLGLFVTLILPAFYIGMTTFHQDLLQTPLLIRIAASRSALPYPVLIEAVFMLITFELIREAGIRMPKTFGGSIVTILGLVLIGQAAVQAGIIGPILMIVVSVTALTSFILPNYAFHQIIRLCGIPLLLMAGLFGFMGIIIVLMFGLAHLVSLRSFGVPYFSPVSPARKEGWKDVFIRAPWWAMETRAPGLGVENINRTGNENMAKSKVNKGDHDEE